MDQKSFFSKIQLWRVSEYNTETIKPYSFNPGTKLSKPRFSSFWIAGEKEWCDIYGLRIALTSFVINKENIDLTLDRDRKERTKIYKKYRRESGGIFYINSDIAPESVIRKYIDNNPIYLYGLKIKGYKTGAGWHNSSEYTIDREVVPDTKEVLKYNYFKKYIKYLSKDEYNNFIIKKEQEKISKKDEKKYDDGIGFPYYNEPQKKNNEKLIEFFNTAIKYAMKEKDDSIQLELMKEISEKYFIVVGYSLKLNSFHYKDLKIPENYLYLFEK